MNRIPLVILILAVSACATLMPMGTQHNFLIDGNSISYVRSFAGSPTVVFESGLGDGMTSWVGVYIEVQKFSGVLAYSRPGYSAGLQRPASGGIRTAKESARLLYELLQKSAAPAPYILVGHSIGGLYVLEFARNYPHLVAGLVLVDGRLPTFTARCEAADVGLCLPPDSAVATAPAHVAAEIRGIRPSEAVAPSAADIGAIPTTLIAATKPPPGASDEVQPIWLEVQKQFADSLQSGKFVLASGSGHYIQRDAPDLVIQEIRAMVDRNRKNP